MIRILTIFQSLTLMPTSNLQIVDRDLSCFPQQSHPIHILKHRRTFQRPKESFKYLPLFLNPLDKPFDPDLVAAHRLQHRAQIHSHIREILKPRLHLQLQQPQITHAQKLTQTLTLPQTLHFPTTPSFHTLKQLNCRRPQCPQLLHDPTHRLPRLSPRYRLVKSQGIRGRQHRIHQQNDKTATSLVPLFTQRTASRPASCAGPPTSPSGLSSSSRHLPRRTSSSSCS